MNVIGVRVRETWIAGNPGSPKPPRRSRRNRRRRRHHKPKEKPFDWTPAVCLGGSFGIAAAIGGLGGAIVGVLLLVLSAVAYAKN